MREIILVSDDSTDTSLVFRTDDGEEFFLAVDDDVRAALAQAAAAGQDDSPSKQLSGDRADSGTDRDPVAASDADDAPHTHSAPTAQPTPAAPSQPRSGLSAVSDSPSTPATSSYGSTSASRPLSDAITMRPAEIQHRVRAGASAAELAEEMGVAESRVEPFAHPVMLERMRIAELAKQAHPVRADGPAKLTLWEILATAFAARGHTLAEAAWDAYREQGEPWVIRLTWTAGLSENEAEWLLKQSMTSASTVEARNSVAADLTDPDFVQPVRSLTSVGRGNRARYDEAIDRELDAADYGAYDDYEDFDAALRNASSDDSTSETDITRDDIPQIRRADATSDSAAGASSDSDNSAIDGDEPDDEFLQNPDPEAKPAKRRRKAVTPHWEDVLLGVRANTKRPRD